MQIFPWEDLKVLTMYMSMAQKVFSGVCTTPSKKKEGLGFRVQGLGFREAVPTKLPVDDGMGWSTVFSCSTHFQRNGRADS